MPPESTSAPAAPTESSAVLRRRARILTVARALAQEGGYDAVQMRTVADQSEVALGTLYRYYPSKVHLLVSTFAREFTVILKQLEERPVTGARPGDRAVGVLERIAAHVQRDRNLTDALTRSVLFADSTVAEEVHEVEVLLATMLARAIEDEPGLRLEDAADETAVLARVIRDLWLAALVAWSAGRNTSLEAQQYMASAVRLVLR